MTKLPAMVLSIALCGLPFAHAHLSPKRDAAYPCEAALRLPLRPITGFRRRALHRHLSGLHLTRAHE